jgi:prepilin-type N-terminal cleavage/methylation domain-containing protein
MNARASSVPQEIRNPKSAIRNCSRRGITLIEMIVVLAIILILASLTVGAYNRMQASQRVAGATDRVMTLLQQARNLAISQNAIYHIRIENPWNPAILPSGAPGDQYLTIQRFPKTSVAQKVAATTDVEPTAAHAWSPWPPVKDPTTGEFVINTAIEALDPLTSNPYNNYRVNVCRLDRPVCVGLQAAKLAITAPTTVLSFYPDGSASTNVTIYVTDDLTFAENQPAPADYPTVNDGRWDAFNQKTGTVAAKQWARINMIDVYQGGLIKLRRRDPNAP